MEINIGTKIRALRKQKNLTQEELAEKLSVSSQAISKWENNTCYPDMVQIPVLANFFGVSLDELFCYDITQLNAKIDAVIEESKRYFWNKPDKCEEILKNALREYPSNGRLLTELISLYEAQARSFGKTEYLEKAIPLAEEIISEEKDIFNLCRTKANLASFYKQLGRYDDAKAIIDTLPEMYPYMLCDKMRESSYQLKGEDRLKWAKDWKIIEIQELYCACDMEGAGYFETGKYEEALVSFGQYRRVIEMFMKSDEIFINSYLWEGMQTHHWCSYLREAGCLAKLGKVDEAKAKLERAHEILVNSWKEKDGSADYFAEKPEEFLEPFRRYYSDWGLDELGPCEW